MPLNNVAKFTRANIFSFLKHPLVVAVIAVFLGAFLAWYFTRECTNNSLFMEDVTIPDCHGTDKSGQLWTG
jgi:hypothetical protein